jgi:general secretion pathway protein M
MNLPTGIRGRALAVFLVFALVAAAVAAVSVPAYVLYNRYDDARSAAESRIDRYHRVSSVKVEYQRALEMLKARESGRFILKNSAPNLGGGELTDLVRPMLESNGSRLTSIQPVTVKDEAGFRVYSINVGFNATPAALQKTLYALETSIPYLFLENVTLRATVPRGYKPPPNQEPEVSAQIEIQAYGPKTVIKSAQPTLTVGGASKG